MPLPRKPERRPAQVPARLRGAVQATPRGARPGPAPTWSSATAATSRCRPTSPPGAASCRSWSTSRTPLPGLANKAGARIARRVAVSFPDTPLPQARVRRAADPHDDLAARPGRAARRGPRASSASTPTGRRCWSPAARRARAGSTRRSPAPPRALADAGVQVLHVVGPAGRGAPRGRRRRRTSSCRFVDRMDLALRRRRPRGLPRRRQQRHRGRRGRAAGDLRAAADRQRRAGAQRPAGRRRRGRAAGGRRRPHRRLGGRPRAGPGRPTPSGWPRWARRPPALVPARRRRAAGPHRPRGRPTVGAADEGARPRRAAAGRGARPGALRRHRRRRPVRRSPGSWRPAASPVTGSDDNDTPFLAGAARARRRRATSATPPSTSATPTPSSSRRRRARTTPRSLEARRRGLRVLPRSAGLWSVMAGRRVVAVAGTHGKTTTTSLLTVGAAGGRRRPDVRRRRRSSPRPAATPTRGAGDLFVAEADESDGAFLVYRPHAAIVTNVEADHLDCGGPRRPTAPAFDEFAGDRRPRRASWSAASTTPVPPTWPRGARPRADGRHRGRVARRRRARDRPAFVGATSRSPCAAAARCSARSRCGSPGGTTSLDALAALAAGLRARLPLRADLRRGLAAFAGTRRRMERKGEAGGRPGLRQLRPPPDRDRRRPRRPPGRWRATAGSWSPSSRTWSRAPGSSAPRWAQALGAADEVVVLDVYLAREDADPAVTGALVADAVPAAARAGRLRARPRRRPPPSWSPAPARATWCSPSAPAASPSSARRCWRCSAARSDEPATRASDATADRPSGPPCAPRKRFARRQWRRRWLAWRYVARRAPAGRAGRRRRSGSSTSRPCSPSSGVEVERRRLARRAPRSWAGRGVPTASRWPASTSTRSRPGCGALAAVRVRRRVPAVARRRADRRRGARRRSRSSRSAAGCAAWTPTAWSSATTTRRRPACRASDSTSSTTPDALEEAADGGRGAAAGAARRWSTTSRCSTVDQITLVLRDGRIVLWGSADESDDQGRGAPASCSASPAKVYDVSRPRPADHLPLRPPRTPASRQP